MWKGRAGRSKIEVKIGIKCEDQMKDLPCLKGTVSPDYKCLEVISIKSPLLGDVTPDIKKILNSSFNF